MSDPTKPLAPIARRRRVSGTRVLLMMLAFVLLAAIPAVVIPVWIGRHETPKLDDLGTLTPFTLTDERGQVFTEAALRGHPTIVSFIFTRCDSICPITSMKMARIQEKTADVPGIKLLSISIDPAYDTPAIMAAYAKHYGADPERWRFVTGAPDKIHDLVEGQFMQSMMRYQQNTPSGAPNIAHRGAFMLVDGDLHLRGLFDSNDIHRLDELIHDARYLARIEH